MQKKMNCRVIMRIDDDTFAQIDRAEKCDPRKARAVAGKPIERQRVARKNPDIAHAAAQLDFGIDPIREQCRQFNARSRHAKIVATQPFGTSGVSRPIHLLTKNVSGSVPVLVIPCITHGAT